MYELQRKCVTRIETDSRKTERTSRVSQDCAVLCPVTRVAAHDWSI